MTLAFKCYYSKWSLVVQQYKLKTSHLKWWTRELSSAQTLSGLLCWMYSWWFAYISSMLGCWVSAFVGWGWDGGCFSFSDRPYDCFVYCFIRGRTPRKCLLLPFRWTAFDQIPTAQTLWCTEWNPGWACIFRCYRTLLQTLFSTKHLPLETWMNEFNSRFIAHKM